MYARWICKLALPHGFPHPLNIHALTADDLVASGQSARRTPKKPLGWMTQLDSVRSPCQLTVIRVYLAMLRY